MIQLLAAAGAGYVLPRLLPWIYRVVLFPPPQELPDFLRTAAPARPPGIDGAERELRAR